MANEAQVFEDAFDVLYELQEGDDDKLASASKKMVEVLRESLNTNLKLKESPDFTEPPDATEVRRRVVKRMDLASKDVIKRKNEKDPKYKTPVFKCQSDYAECLKTGSSTCLALFIICVGKHIIPFVRHPK